MKHTIVGISLLALLLAACKKEEPTTTAPTLVPPPLKALPPTPPATIPAPPQFHLVRHPASGIILRPTWTAADPDPVRLRSIGTVAAITLCQEPTEVSCTDTDPAAIADYLEQMRKTALVTGMADIPYHFAIDSLGRAWQLRNILAEGEHTKGKNAGNIGILILGDPNRPMTTIQQDAARKLIAALSIRYSLPTLAVFAHDDLVKNDIPGPDVKKMVADIRKPPPTTRPRGR